LLVRRPDVESRVYGFYGLVCVWSASALTEFTPVPAQNRQPNLYMGLQEIPG